MKSVTDVTNANKDNLLLVSLEFQILLSDFVHEVLSHLVLYSLQLLEVLRSLLFVRFLEAEGGNFVRGQTQEQTHMLKHAIVCKDIYT